MTLRKVTALPIDDAAAMSLLQWIALSDATGGPLPGKLNEWMQVARSMARELKSILKG